MKIIKFSGTKVHDYLTINLIFNHDLSVITGANGSGKTTAILLLQAILCPNFRDLLSIPFEHLDLQFVHKNVTTSVRVKSDSRRISIQISSVPDILHIKKIPQDELEYLNYKQKDGPDIIEMMIKDIGAHPVIDFIKQIPSPVFIGLERRLDELQNEREDYVLERRLFLNKSRHDISSYKRQFKGTLGVSLLETEFLIQAIYKRIRVIEDKYANDLQNEILLSSFEYITFDSNISAHSTYRERRNLLSRRKEIEEAMKKIGYGERRQFSEKLNYFFEKLEILVDNIDSDEVINIEWLLNQSQIDKLSKLVKIIDDYKSKVLAGFRPINKFLNIINSYFSDSLKSIVVDEVGHLVVLRPNGKSVSIDALSSGERQLVILFANVMFNKHSSESRENILIIDEPELSLHIKWQSKFIDSLLTASDNTQFILATHSPDIVGDHKYKCVKINS